MARRKKGKGPGWHGESRRHSYARMGYKTVIDDKKRMHMGDFSARGIHEEAVKRNRMVRGEINSDDQPLRYMAFDNPAVWIEKSNPEERKWVPNIASWNYTVTNRHYPHLQDGAYVSIIYNEPNDYFFMDATMNLPNADRTQFRRTKRSNSYEGAKREAYKWINEVVTPKLKEFEPEELKR